MRVRKKVGSGRPWSLFSHILHRRGKVGPGTHCPLMCQIIISMQILACDIVLFTSVVQTPCMSKREGISIVLVIYVNSNKSD